MQLTKIERLMLSNQFRILAKLYPDEAKAFENYRKVVEEGFTLDYSRLSKHIEEEVPESTCEYVLDVLELFSDLKFAYKDLKDKSGIEEHSISFRGFDGNNETVMMSYAIYYVKDLGKFSGFESIDFNSHMPTTGIYSQMLDAWRPIKEKTLSESRKLSKEEILEIIKTKKAA